MLDRLFKLILCVVIIYVAIQVGIRSFYAIFPAISVLDQTYIGIGIIIVLIVLFIFIIKKLDK